jgi:hypothetical protein
MTPRTMASPPTRAPAVADDALRDRQCIVERVALIEHADAHAAAHRHTTAVGVETSGEHREEARLAVAVASDDADAVALVDAERDGVEDDLGGELEMQRFAAEEVCHVPPGYGSGSVPRRRAVSTSS